MANCPTKNCAEIALFYHTSVLGCSTFIASDSCGTIQCLKAAHFLAQYYESGLLPWTKGCAGVFCSYKEKLFPPT